MTQKLNKDNGLQRWWTRISVANMTLAKVAIQYSADTFVDNQSLVLRINICGVLTVYISKIRFFTKRQNVSKNILIAFCNL
jgi:hypothetical protein